MVATPQVADGRVTANVKVRYRWSSARLHYTTGPHPENPTREWVTQPLEIRERTISGRSSTRRCHSLVCRCDR